MSIKTIFSVAAAMLFAIAAILSITLIFTTSWLQRATIELSAATNGVLASKEIELQLLRFNREQMLYAGTGDSIHLEYAESAQRSLAHWLQTVQMYVTGPEEKTLLNDMKLHIEKRLAKPESSVSDAEAYRRSMAALNPAFVAIERFISVNLDQAARARQDSERWDRIADKVAFSLLALTAVIFGALLYLVRRLIYLPSLRLRKTICDYIENDTLRLPDEGPTEFRDIAMIFNRMADELSRQRQRQLTFLAAVAHDLRNPLSALKTSTELTLRRAGTMTVETSKRHAELIQRQVTRMDRMIGDFLDLSLVHAGKLDLRLETCDIRTVVRDTATLFEGASEKHRLEVRIPGAPIAARCDPFRLEQILNNLVSNAIKYSPDGGQVDVRVSQDGQKAIIEVRDEGIGIAGCDLQNLFRPFHRVGSLKESIPGVGLGLSVVKKLVEAHNGWIEAESRLGKGSTFRVHLPLTT